MEVCVHRWCFVAFRFDCFMFCHFFLYSIQFIPLDSRLLLANSITAASKLRPSGPSLLSSCLLTPFCSLKVFLVSYLCVSWFYLPHISSLLLLHSSRSTFPAVYSPLSMSLVCLACVHIFSAAHTHSHKHQRRSAFLAKFSIIATLSTLNIATRVNAARVLTHTHIRHDESLL